MAEQELRVRTKAGEMTVFAAHPDGPGPFPVAVLYMDGIGYREQVKENARRFAAGGYYCVAPDLFYRSGSGLHFDMPELAAEEPAGPLHARLREVRSEVRPDEVVADTKAVFAAIADDPVARPGQKVCVGYCMGARHALRLAARLGDRIAAAAGIHPGALVTDASDSPHRDLAEVQAELYFAFAENDRSATPEVVERFRAEMERAGVEGVVERLPGTEHGFALADLPVYDRGAAEHHFERTLALWERTLAA